MPEILTDEMANLIWTGAEISAPAAKEINPPQVATPPTTVSLASSTEDDNDDNNHQNVPPKVETKTPSGRDKITSIFSVDDEDDEDEQDEPDNNGNQTQNNQSGEQKKGRRTTDLVSVVSKLVEDGELSGYENAEIKTNEDAIELIKLNLKETEKTAVESAFKEKVKTFSPQVQAVLHYAEQGVQSATEIMELMGAMKNIEDLYNYDISTPEGIETVIRQGYKSKGFKDAFIEKQISRLKDAGDAAFKEEAETFLPELIAENEAKVEQKIRQQEEIKKRTEDASRVYLTTVQTALSKETLGEIPIKKDDKYKLYEAVANPKYTSLGGMNTTQFVKTLEDLQFGEKPDYEHFLNVVRYAIDKEGFLASVKATLNNGIQADTQKILRQTKVTTPNSVQPEVRTQNTKKVIKKEFSNPFG